MALNIQLDKRYFHEQRNIDVFFLAKDAKSKEKLESVLDKLSDRCLEAYGNRLSPYILTEQEAKGKARQKVLFEIKKGIEIFHS